MVTIGFNTKMVVYDLDGLGGTRVSGNLHMYKQCNLLSVSTLYLSIPASRCVSIHP